MEEMLIGVTDRTILVFVSDSASTTGAGKTALAHSAITVSYTRVETDNDVVNTDVTSSLNALTNLTDAHNDWGWKEVSATLAPGLYRLDLADAMFATGAWYAEVHVAVTSGLASVVPKSFRLVSVNALDSVRHGLTALPNAAAEAAGGLYTRGTGAGQINQAANGQVDANAVAVSGDSAAADTLETAYDGTAGPVPEHGIIDQGTAQAATATTIQLRSAASFADDTIIGATVFAFGSTQGYWQVQVITDYVLSTDTATVPGWAVTPSGTITYKIFGSAAGQGVAQTGDAFARLGAPAGASIAADIATRASQTSVDDLPTNAELATSQAAADDATLAAIAALNNISTAQVNAEVDTALADVGLTTTVTGRIDAAVSTRASQTSVDDVPTNAELATALGTADDATLAAIAALNNLSSAQAQTAAAAALTAYDPPTNTEMEARTLTAASISKLTSHLNGVLIGVVGSGSTTTSLVLNASTGIDGGAPSSTNDFYNGRVVIFLSGTLAKQATSISDYVGSTVTATVVALTSAPSAGDTFLVV